MLTARTEVTDRMLIFGQRHLQLVLAQYEAHCNGRRPHRSRHLHPPRPDHPVADLTQKQIKRRAVLGGLINEYERAAQKPRSGTVAEFWNPTGVYRPPFAAMGAGLDRAILHSVADATVRSLLARVADVLARPQEPAGAVQGTGMTGAATRQAAAEMPWPGCPQDGGSG